MHTVVVLALPGTILSDLATPLDVLGRARDEAGRLAYRVTVAAPEPSIEASGLCLHTGHGLDELAGAATVVLPGREEPTAPVPDDALDALRTAAGRGARLVSICVGAFTLAATGLLDGRRATTHWRAAEAFRDRYPAVRLDPAVLYVDEGALLSSAGASAGIDLCLHLIERDLGTAAAAQASRMAVSPLHRDGGQAQYVPRRIELTDGGSLAPVLAWLAERSEQDIALRDVAARAGCSERTLNRRFQEETGHSPVRWLTRVRLHQARELLEATDAAVEHIGRRVGFRSPAAFRTAFTEAHGVAPRTYRRTFRGSPPAAGDPPAPPA